MHEKHIHTHGLIFFSRKSKFVGNPLSYYYDHLRDVSVKTESFRDLFTKSNRSHLI